MDFLEKTFPCVYKTETGARQIFAIMPKISRTIFGAISLLSKLWKHFWIKDIFSGVRSALCLASSNFCRLLDSIFSRDRSQRKVSNWIILSSTAMPLGSEFILTKERFLALLTLFWPLPFFWRLHNPACSVTRANFQLSISKEKVKK